MATFRNATAAAGAVTLCPALYHEGILHYIMWDVAAWATVVMALITEVFGCCRTTGVCAALLLMGAVCLSSPTGCQCIAAAHDMAEHLSAVWWPPQGGHGASLQLLSAAG